MTLEENSLKFELGRAKRLRDLVVLNVLYTRLEEVRTARGAAQQAYRIHRKSHNAASKRDW